MSGLLFNRFDYSSWSADICDDQNVAAAPERDKPVPKFLVKPRP